MGPLCKERGDGRRARVELVVCASVAEKVSSAKEEEGYVRVIPVLLIEGPTDREDT